MVRILPGNGAAVPSTPTPVFTDPSPGSAERYGHIGSFRRGAETISLISALKSDATYLTTILRDLGFVSLCKISSLSADLSTAPTKYAAIVCHRQVRSQQNLPVPLNVLASRVIVLSDCTNEETAIDFLASGARHFFDIRESHTLLQERLYAALRRHQSSVLSALTVGDVHLDRQKSQVIRHGLSVKLTPKEFAFACQLFSKVGQVVGNEELMTSIWSLSANVDTRRIDSIASLVRKKLRLVRDEGWELKRIRCVGYQLIQTSCPVEVD